MTTVDSNFITNAFLVNFWMAQDQTPISQRFHMLRNIFCLKIGYFRNIKYLAKSINTTIYLIAGKLIYH